MEFTYDDVKSKMDKIIEEFDEALLVGDYDKAKKMTLHTLRLYQTTLNIELDRTPEFDHDFQALMERMDESLKTAYPSPANTDRYVDVHTTIAKVVDQIAQVSEVRRRVMELDPKAEDLIKSYEDGILEAKASKEKIAKAKEDYIKIREEVVTSGGKNIFDEIALDKFILTKEVLIREKVKEINELQRGIDILNQRVAAGEVTKEQVEKNIKADEDAIKEGLGILAFHLEDIRKRGIDTSTFDGVLSEKASDRTTALNDINNLRLDYLLRYEKSYRTLADNLISAKTKYPDMDFFKKLDVSKLDPSTVKGREEIDTLILSLFDIEKHFTDAEKIQDNRIEIFTKSIEQVKEEVKIIDSEPVDRDTIASKIPDEIQKRIEEEEEYYRQDAYDKLYGDSDKAEKYRIYLKALKASIESKEFVLREINGNELLDKDKNIRKGFYQTVNMEKFKAALPTGTTPEEALKLLQLEEYSERLERVTKNKAGDRFVYTTLPSYKVYSDPTVDDETRNKALKMMQLELEEDAVYIKTNHLASNTHEFMAKAIGDAGTLVKYKNGRKLISKEKGLGKVGAVFYNAGSLLGLSNPAKARGAGGKILTTAIDGLLLASSPILLPTKLIYRYTPIIGKEAQKKRYIEKYADQDSSPYDGLDYSRKMKRREYYKSQMGGIFKGARAWIKATNDNLFRHDRAEETEKAITEDFLEKEVFPSITARYVNGAVAGETVKKEKAKANLTTRIDAIREIAGRDYAYNDLIAEPGRADHKLFETRVIQGAALELAGEDSSELRYSDTIKTRDVRHIKPIKPITRVLGALHGDLAADKIDFTPEGGVANTDAIGRKTREKAIIGRKTATNYIPYTLTAIAVGAGVKYSVSKIKDVIENHVDEVPGYYVKRQDGFRDEVIGQRKEVIGTEEVVVGERWDTSTMPSTPRQFTTAYDGKSGDLFYSVWGGERQGYIDPNIDLTRFDYSAGFHIESADGSIRFALANHQNGGQYDYLGTLVRDYGMKPEQIDRFLDPATGAFRPDANLFELAAEAMTASGRQGITGEVLKEMVLSGEAKSYVALVAKDGGTYGGWLNTMTGQSIPEMIPITETRDILGMVDITRKVPNMVEEWVEAIPAHTELVEDAKMVAIKKFLDRTATGMGGATLVEGTAKLAAMPKSKRHGPDKAVDNEPKRSSKEGFDSRSKRIDDERI